MGDGLRDMRKSRGGKEIYLGVTFLEVYEENSSERKVSCGKV